MQLNWRGILSCTMVVTVALWCGAAFAQTQTIQITNGPAVQNVSPTAATVTWSTNVPAGTVVKYGTNPNNLDQTAQQSWGGTNHSAQLSNLQPSTMYFFQVQSNHALGSGSGICGRQVIVSGS